MKTILIMIDGLNYQVAQHSMGYLLGECAAGHGHFRQIEAELPSMSRPLYETILTGKTPIESGIVHNNVVRLSKEKSIFHHAKSLGKISAAAAYHWFSELYNDADFQVTKNRFTFNPELTIPYGIFYFEEDYPDSHVFADSEYLRETYDPDFLLIHASMMDTVGHHFGGDSPQYRNAARKLDEILAHYLPQWLSQDYQLFITADHGINADKNHGGNLPEEINVPLFILGSDHEAFINQTIAQTDICPIICQLLEQ